MTSTVKFLLLAGLLFSRCASLYASDADYAVSKIPADMKNKANAVVRNYHTEMKIESPGEINIVEKYAVTILNEKGAKYGCLYAQYGRFIEIDRIEGRLYSNSGETLEKLKKKEVRDVSPYSANFIDDIHYKAFKFGISSYPYTVEFEIESKLTVSLFLPDWHPQFGFDCSVESADLEVEYPKDFLLRYRTFHLDSKPLSANAEEGNKITASVNLLPARDEPEDFAPAENFHLPAIIFSADNFEMLDLKGSMATWQALGYFFYELNANRDELPDATKKKVHELTDTCRYPKEKIDILYEYLKKNTRYVSIQLGIGGWQTFDAKFVAEKGYGDCKALSNYMKALLKEAGITSYQAFAIAGDGDKNKMIIDFPSNVFNHVILCVTVAADTTWLECTSKTLPAGYLSSFTDGRYVLLLTPAGGFPVRTPANIPSDNYYTRTAKMQVTDKDEMTGEIDLKYGGYFWESEHRRVTDVPKSAIDNYLNSKFVMGSYSVGDYKITNDIKNIDPCITESIPIKGEGNVSRTKQYIFLTPGIFSGKLTSSSSAEQRKDPFQLIHSYQVSDTICYQLPCCYTMEKQKDISMDFDFATYRYNVELSNNNVLKIIRSYTQKEGVYPAQSFADYMKLFKQMNADATGKIALLRQN